MPHPTLTTVRPRRHKAALIPLLLAIAVVTACSRGPSESQMLPEKNLVYPGAIEVGRNFYEEDFGRTVNGNPYTQPAELSVKYQVSDTLDVDRLQSWYRDELSRKGWTYRDWGPNAKSSALEMTIEREGYEHKYIVEGGVDRLSVRYQLRRK